MAKRKARKKAWGFGSDSQTLNKCLQEFDKYIVKKKVVKGTKNSRRIRAAFFIQERSFRMLVNLGLCPK